jgi:hypothetical protein
MGNVYYYEDDLQVADNEPVIIRVELPDKGTSSCATSINTPMGILSITDEGTKTIGNGEILKVKPVKINSNPLNFEQRLEKIRVNIYANEKLIAEHINEKEESKTPLVKVTLTVT